MGVVKPLALVMEDLLKNNLHFEKLYSDCHDDVYALLLMLDILQLPGDEKSHTLRNG